VRFVVVLVTAALLAAGCGSKQSGRTLFGRECAGCHSLAGHESGAMGGDLAIPLLAVSDIESFARTMPTPDHISSSEVRTIAAYVRSRELTRSERAGTRAPASRTGSSQSR
jgi:mono/diheme cytochrome c family protein